MERSEMKMTTPSRTASHVLVRIPVSVCVCVECVMVG